MNKKTKLSVVIYVVFMGLFAGIFMPIFTEAVGGHEMIDAYLVDFSKSINDIEVLIHNYGEQGRNFMTNFFIADSLYVIISCVMFTLLIKSVTDNKYLKFIPLFTGTFDTIENLFVLYSVTNLNMSYLPLARLFAALKACSLALSIIVIVAYFVKRRRDKKNI